MSARESKTKIGNGFESSWHSGVRPARCKQMTAVLRPYRVSLYRLGLGCLGLLVLLGPGACSKSTSVERVSASEAIDLSGRWNDTDSRQVSEEMIRDSLSWPWVREWRARSGRKPVVMAYGVTNRTSEHINTQIFMKDLERAFLKSGQISVVANRDQRLDIREERAQQQLGLTANPSAVAQELGADFVITGSIDSIEDSEGDRKVLFYQTNLELIHVETNEKAWIGDKKIKKFIKRSRLGL